MEKPGLVFTNCSAGRIVCCVVWAAPDTMPWASPLYTIIVPKYETSFITSLAISMLIPLCFLKSYKVLTYSSYLSDWWGSTMDTFSGSKFSPNLAACFSMSSFTPSKVKWTMFCSVSNSAALRTLSSSPSGSTMCFWFSLAFWVSKYWNIRGVMPLTTTLLVFSSRVSISTYFSNMRRLSSILALLSGVT